MHLSPNDCKHELERLKITSSQGKNRKLVIFQVFPDSAHQAELENYQGHIRLDNKFSFQGAHGRLIYDLQDKNWIPHIGINNPLNCKADTKNKRYQEIMLFDWKIQLEKVHFTRDLKDDTIIYQGIRHPCKNDQGYSDPTTRTQATIVWFPEDTCTTFQVAKIHARVIKFRQKKFIESISFEDVNPGKLRHSNFRFRNIHNIENKLTRFQIYPETEPASKYTKPLNKTHYSEIFVEYEDGFEMNTGKLIIHEMATSRSTTDKNSYVRVQFQKNTGRVGAKLKPQDKDSTRLQELSLMNNTQLERTQMLQSLALAVIKIPHAGYLLSGNRSSLLSTKEIYYGITLAPKKYHLYMSSKTKDAIKESRYSTKIKYLLLIHSPKELIFGIHQSHVDQKIAKM